MGQVNTRWTRSDAARGADYDARWDELAANGENVHGEADLIESLLDEIADPGGAGPRVLDAGCGTGRVAIELARRGFSVTGIDADPAMLAAARAKEPELAWRLGDLADPDTVADLGPFDLVALAGNVMIFLEPGTEERVLDNLAGSLRPGGLLVAGFQLVPDGRATEILTLRRYDEIAARVGLQPVARWAGWAREPFAAGNHHQPFAAGEYHQPFAAGEYAVSVHRRAAPHGVPA